MIINPKVDFYQYASTSFEARVFHVSGNIYGVVYRGNSNAGTVATLQVSDNGVISNSLISLFKFENADAYTPEIIRIYGTTCAIVYRNQSSAGRLVTITISSAGLISGTVLDSLIFSTPGYEPEIIAASGPVFAVAYRGPSNDGFVSTIQIDPSGQSPQLR